MTSNVEAPIWDGVPEGTVVPKFDENGVLLELLYVTAEAGEEDQSIEKESE